MKSCLPRVAAGIIVACLGQGALAQDATIKIGINQPLTGVVAASGNMVTAGAKIAAEDINANGGILGKKIQLVIEDNKSNPTEAASVAEKLITSDKVSALVGAWSSTYTLAVMPKLMEYKVPMIVETSSADKITSSGNPYIFRISPTNSTEAKAFTRFVEPLGIKKADFLVVNNDWGLGAAAEFSKMLKEKGATVNRSLQMDAAAQDLSAQLSSIKSSDSDTLFITTSVEQMTLLMKQAQGLGIKRKIVTTGGTLPDQLIEQAGSAANDSYHDAMFAPWFPDTAGDPDIAKKFIATWTKAGLKPAGMPEGARGYDAVRILAKAIEKAGAADPEKIRAALWQVSYAGLTGNIKFEKVGPEGKESGQSPASTHLVKIEDGKVSLVSK
ncbi:ABC transporter substrate-binding protein [Bradyrhizobium sp. NP1]|jgi:branched-chain amino acid transport system substrate-binding protein|uniref:ABC transporter substrate-binding protein n=1 Tax=Bradyrhizobium sp. NP1 TaxID=3049772 RepID=UPI0025A5B5D6|nr:ABC transporter substrate-binding protein [Bradyrhizobium sp. NP1]WJR80381.1 ABC transporter substrate-binding protein [Bradyrhizobium sp. NP1]